MKRDCRFRSCELCSLRASFFCPADEACLCLHCDAKVHGANFLVARHCRLLLCSSCGALTKGLKTGWGVDPRVHVCRRCSVGSDRQNEESTAEAVSATQSTSSFSSRQSESFQGSLRERVRRRPSGVIKRQGSSSKWPCARPGSPCDEPELRGSSRHWEHVKSVGCVDNSGTESCKVTSADEASCESTFLEVSPHRSIKRKRDRRTSVEELEDSEDGSSSCCSSQAQSCFSESVWPRKGNLLGDASREKSCARSLERVAD